MQATARNLTSSEIEQLANHAGVKARAVENFLATIYAPIGERRNLANMYCDAGQYGWNKATQSAIARGIAVAFGSAKMPAPKPATYATPKLQKRTTTLVCLECGAGTNTLECPRCGSADVDVRI